MGDFWLLVISLFKIALKLSAEIPSNVPKNRKAEMYVKEKTCMFIQA